jgi:SAM-dependent methyltransferase
MIKGKFPWQIKILSKLLLSSLPAKYDFWRKISLFKHGEMEKPDYAFKVFKQHFDRVDFLRKKGGFVALELGPGDSLFSALIAYAHGASRIYLVDTGKFAVDCIKPYIKMANFLKKNNLIPPEFNTNASIQKLLHLCNADYMTAGLSSLCEIPDHSVDFIWSQAVLEHIRHSKFSPLLKELRRVIRTDGICSHCIDLRDHLGGALNHLRFSRRIWESEVMAKSGFYSNRIRYFEMMNLFERAGFSAKTVKLERWAELPTPKNLFSREFTFMNNDELSVAVFDVILTPK